MERKVSVTIEVTEMMMPIIKAYSDGLAEGSIHPAENSYSDQDDLQNLLGEHMPELKALLYEVTGATMKGLFAFHAESLEACAKTEAAHSVARAAEAWAAESLGFTNEEDGDE